MKKFFILLLFLVAFSCNRSSASDNWIWLSDSKVLINHDRNLQWVLSDYEWRVVNKETLPPNVKFCAAIKDAMVTLSLISFKAEEQPHKDVWEGADDFIKGFSASVKSQFGVYPGIKYGKVESKKCYYLFKKALRLSVKITITDSRMGTDEPVDFLYSAYAFEKDGYGYTLILMMPRMYIEEYGMEFCNSFFSSFKYIDATKEVRK